MPFPRCGTYMVFNTTGPGSIEAPPRSSTAGAVIILSALAALCFFLALPDAGGIPALIVSAGLLALAMIPRAVYAVHASLLTLLWVSLAAFVPLFQTWPFSILIPLLFYGILAGVVPQLRSSSGWIHRGRLSQDVIILIIVTVVVSSLSLIAWVILAEPDIGHHLALVPELPLWAYPFAGLGFAVFNAAMEEAVFRGIIMETVDSALGPGRLSVGIQAVPFAALHYLAGFPNGVSGFFMVLIYGAMLGIIRRVSKGMLAPFIAHVMADITIFSILIFILNR